MLRELPRLGTVVNEHEPGRLCRYDTDRHARARGPFHRPGHEIPRQLSGIFSQRAAFLVAEQFRTLVVPLYFRADLTLEQQLYQRAKPLPYLGVAAKLVKEFALKRIVEIGSMRQPMAHPLGGFDPMCCNDGHSTLYLASTGAEVFTVDSNPQCAEVLRAYRPSFPTFTFRPATASLFWSNSPARSTFFISMRGTSFPAANTRRSISRPIDARCRRLAPRCLVQIDDTDILNGGKGRLVVPQMIRDGFELITWGRQAILTRDG